MTTWKNQCDTSATHRQHIESGWKIKHHTEFGRGEEAVSLVEYENGSIWTFDNVSATPVFDKTWQQAWEELSAIL